MKNQKKIAKIQIQYSQDKSFKKGVKTVTAKKNASSKKIRKLKSKKTYYVRFESGLWGKSDGKGNEEGKEYGSFPKGGNGITPNEGYKFTGKYSYVILDDDGNIIKEGMTDDPTSIEIIGNIIFTPIYEKINPLFPVPDTSDLNNSKMFISLLVLSALMIIIVGYLRIKRK